MVITAGQAGRRGFTIVELLVVVAIIAMLIAILLPSLRAAQETARTVKCMVQLRQVSVAFVMFAGEHHRILPGVFVPPYAGTEPWQASWLGNELWAAAPYRGTILPYMGNADVGAKQFYRCPSLPAGVPGSGIGSNGRFDYASLIAFSGARLQSVPVMAQVRDPATLEWRGAATPLVVEEDPSMHLNRNLEPGHANIDRLGTWHGASGGSGNYAAVDGSAHALRFNKAGLGPTPILDWTAVAPSGQTVDLHHTNTGWGDWNGR